MTSFWSRTVELATLDTKALKWITWSTPVFPLLLAVFSQVGTCYIVAAVSFTTKGRASE